MLNEVRLRVACFIVVHLWNWVPAEVLLWALCAISAAAKETS